MLAEKLGVQVIEAKKSGIDCDCNRPAMRTFGYPRSAFYRWLDVLGVHPNPPQADPDGH